MQISLYIYIICIAYTFILLLFVQQSYLLSESQNLNVNHDQLNRSYKQVMVMSVIYTVCNNENNTTKH